MRVESLRIAKVFSGGGEIHYVLPHFQREYAWDKSNWQTLLNDTIAVYDSFQEEDEPEHFLGALVVISSGMRSGTLPTFRLVDGQQRLTTISLALCALSDIVKDGNPQLHRKIRRLLENEDEKGQLRYKLMPTPKNDDREAYVSIISGAGANHKDSRIPDCYEFYLKQFKTRIQSGSFEPEKLFRVLANCMHVVFIELDHRERPYEIFESLNAKGKPLSQSDLVRNYIAMRLPEDRQEDVFTKVWQQMERQLQENRTTAGIGEMTAFLRHYLAFHSGALPNQDHVYARLRDRMEQKFPPPNEFIAEVYTLQGFANYYDRLIHPSQEPNHTVREQLNRLKILETSTAYPFLLGLYDWYEQKRISFSDSLEGLQILENYFVRRLLAAEQTAYTNKMFPMLIREVDSRRLPESLKKALLSKNYPSDSRIRQQLATSSMYNSRNPQRLVLILETVNKSLSKGTGGYTVLSDNATVEHIMPQQLTTIWKEELGVDWEETHREYLHTIGNLTLVTQEWNSQLSNSSFGVKRERLQRHALILNSLYFQDNDPNWGRDAIKRRSNWLCDHILHQWPAFGEPPTKLDTKGQTPETLIIMNEVYEVSSWRDVAYHMSNTLALLMGLDEFNRVAHELTTYFRTDSTQRTKQLENAPQWWLYVNLSSNSVMNLCSQLTSFAGLSDSDWEITLKTLKS